MKNIGIMVSGNGTNLQAIIDAIKSGKINNGRIVTVISNKKDAYALERARSNDIPNYVFLRKEYSSKEEYGNAILQCLIENKIDLIVLAGYLSILDTNIVNKYENKIINIHPSLIPSFCGKGYYGLKVHEEVLKRGVKITGATVHFVNSDIDGGPIILQKSVHVLDDDTKEILQKRVMEECEHIILPEAISLFCNDKLETINGKVKIRK